MISPYPGDRTCPFHVFSVFPVNKQCNKQYHSNNIRGCVMQFAQDIKEYSTIYTIEIGENSSKVWEENMPYWRMLFSFDWSTISNLQFVQLSSAILQFVAWNTRVLEKVLGVLSQDWKIERWVREMVSLYQNMGLSDPDPDWALALGIKSPKTS